LEKKWEYKNTVTQLLKDCKKAFEPVKKEEFYNIFIVFGVAMKLHRFIQICLNETCSKVYKTKIYSLIN
jgi:hypothetical protein